jgi:3-methyladenine DNA glycosylase AlkD
MTTKEIVGQLKTLGADSYKKILLNHGVKEPAFGVKIEELKKIQAKEKKNHPLALELYDTGIYDAMYLAGLVTDPAKMTKADLSRWLSKANCSMLAEYTVAWTASESPVGWALALEWIESKDETTASCGWAILRSIVAIKPDAELDMGALRKLLQRIQTAIHKQPNRVRYVMNGFVTALGTYVPSMTDAAIEAAEIIGPVEVNMEGTSCKVPSAAEQIQKALKRKAIGKKRKTAFG